MAAAKKGKSSAPPGSRSIARNKKALFDYEVVEKVEAGLVLKGSEVKSLREGKVVMGDAYAGIEDGEIFLRSLHIPEYVHGAYANHDPIRDRKLLLHREEIGKLHQQVRVKGMTIVPLELYFRGGKAKVMIALVRGRATHDKRHAIRARDESRAAAREDS